MPDYLYKIDTGKYFWVEAKSSSYISYFTIICLYFTDCGHGFLFSMIFPKNYIH